MRGKSKASESPCKDICTVDERQKLCTGCYRTLEEIAKWRRYSDAQRNKVMGLLAKRERQYRSGGRIS